MKEPERCSKHNDFDDLQKEKIEKFFQAVDGCKDVDELEAIEKIISSIAPTVMSIQQTSGKLISAKIIPQIPGSQGKSRNIQHQQRFSKETKKRVRTYKKRIKGNLAVELFKTSTVV